MWLNWFSFDFSLLRRVGNVYDTGKSLSYRESTALECKVSTNPFRSMK